MFRKVIIAFLFLMVLFCNIQAAEEEVLISKEFVDYFRKVSRTTGIPITIHVKAYDGFTNTQRVEDERVVPEGSFPVKVTMTAIQALLPGFNALLPSLLAGKDPSHFELVASIFVKHPEHNEKFEGARSLETLLQAAS